MLPVLARDCPITRDVPRFIGSPEKTTPDGNKEQGATNIETDDGPFTLEPNEIVVTASPKQSSRRNNDKYQVLCEPQ